MYRATRDRALSSGPGQSSDVARYTVMITYLLTYYKWFHLRFCHLSSPGREHKLQSPTTMPLGNEKTTTSCFFLLSLGSTSQQRYTFLLSYTSTIAVEPVFLLVISLLIPSPVKRVRHEFAVGWQNDGNDHHRGPSVFRTPVERMREPGQPLPMLVSLVSVKPRKV